MMLIKRYLFWIFIDNQNESWYDYWLNNDLGGYAKFKNFAMNHEFYDDSCSMVLQDKVTLFQILSDFFDTDIENDFDAKFNIWLMS